MKARSLMFLMIGMLCLLITACSNTENPPTSQQEEEKQSSSNEEAENKSDNESPSPQEEDREKGRIEKLIDKMTTEEKIAQMMFIGLQGTSLSNEEAELIRNEKVGGVILLGGNIQNETQLLQYMKNIKQANKTNHTPLMLGVDEEGGRVSRIPDSIANFPSSQYIGAHGSPSTSREIGQLLAQKVKAFGFNVNFAPVLDIHNNPQNNVIGDRSFGTTPNIVSEFGIATMNGIKSEGVIPVVKHFPGHGNTSVDSHVSLPNVDKSIEDIKEEEIIPFQKAFNEGADMVMVAHILYSAFDQEYPATLSKRIITDFLREEMEFEGVVITDDMSMGAITQNYGMEEAAVLSIRAGTDMFMLTSSGEGNYDRVKSALIQAVKQGKIKEQSLNNSVRRILKLKDQYELTHKLPDGVNNSTINQKIREVKEKMN